MEGLYVGLVARMLSYFMC